jgi:hypothetical protein
MSFSEFTQNMRNALLEVTPAAGEDVFGRPIPAIAAKHTIGVLSKFVAGIDDAIRRLTGRDNCVRSTNVDGDGILTVDAQITQDNLGISDSIPNAKYIGGVGSSDQPFRRLPLDAALDAGGIRVANVPFLREITFEPALDQNALKAEETDLMQELHQCMRFWQRAVDASARAFTNHANNVSALMSNDEAFEFWDAIGKVAGSLDAQQANPPIDTFDAVKQATKDALHESERVVEQAAQDGAEIAGEVAARAGDAAGKAAGSFAKGFFNQATLVSLIVAGVAVYIATR